MARTWWCPEGSFEAALMRAARLVSKPEHTQMERSLSTNFSRFER
jgi:hypothetical protein